MWYETQCSFYGGGWKDDYWPRFDTEREVREYVARLNKPLPTVTTTVLKD